MTTKCVHTPLDKIRTQVHVNCAVCSPWNSRGMGLEFKPSKNGGVEASFHCGRDFEGYENLLHGGVIAMILDGAMTNCMFAHERPAVTAELNVRFRHPIITDKTATVHAWVEDSTPPLHILKAEITQDGQLKATAIGKFMEQPSLTAEKNQE